MLAVLPPAYAAAGGKDLQSFQEEQLAARSIPIQGSNAAARPPGVDPKRIVNQSSAFLKEREPEMTEEEAAVYERLRTMLGTNMDLAVRMLQDMVGEKQQSSPAFEFILGNAYFTANQLDRAEAMYRSAVARFPSFLRAWNNLGITCYTQGRYPEAAACFSKAVSLGDRDPVTFNLLGYALEEKGDLISAEMAYLQALSGDPDNADCKEGLLRIYIAGRQFGRAEPLARFLVKVRPGEARGWSNYAGILLSQGRKVEAMVVLEEAGAAGVAGPDEWELLGDLYAEQNLATEAIAAYQQVSAAARPRGEGRLLQLARVLAAVGRFDEAERILAAVSDRLTPASRIEWLRARADLRLAQKQWAEARKEIEALLALEPLNGRGLLALARTYQEEGNLPRAAFAYESAIRIPEAAYEASVELANIEIQNRHFAKSVEHLERALSLQKTDAIEDTLVRVRSLVPHETTSR